MIKFVSECNRSELISCILYIKFVSECNRSELISCILYMIKFVSECNRSELISCILYMIKFVSECNRSELISCILYMIKFVSECNTDPSKCINDHTLRSNTEFCRTSLLKLSDKCPTKLSDKILPGRSESLHSQIVKL
jgi:hypothetical protein